MLYRLEEVVWVVIFCCEMHAEIRCLKISDDPNFRLQLHWLSEAESFIEVGLLLQPGMIEQLIKRLNLNLQLS